MKAVVQRVAVASVTVDDIEVGGIGPGIVVLVAAEVGDKEADSDILASKLSGLRIFRDDDGRMNRSVVETNGEVLVVSQFTLAAEVARGRRPSFTRAADPETAAHLVGRLVVRLSNEGLNVAEGQFGAQMSLSLVNDGPVTIIIETSEGRVV